TRHRSFTAEVERGQRVHLAGIRRPDGHAVLLLHLRIRGSRLHAAELDRRPGVPIEVGQEHRDPHCPGRKLDRLAGADPTPSRGDRFAVAGYEPIARMIVGAGALEVSLDQPAAGDLPLLDGAMDVGDRCLYELELGHLRFGARPPQERQTNQGDREQGRRDSKQGAGGRRQSILRGSPYQNSKFPVKSELVWWRTTPNKPHGLCTKNPGRSFFEAARYRACASRTAPTAWLATLGALYERPRY